MDVSLLLYRMFLTDRDGNRMASECRKADLCMLASAKAMYKGAGTILHA